MTLEQSLSDSKDLAEGRQDVLGVFGDIIRRLYARSRTGIVWEGVKSLSEPLFSGAGFILVPEGDGKPREGRGDGAGGGGSYHVLIGSLTSKGGARLGGGWRE